MLVLAAIGFAAMLRWAPSGGSPSPHPAAAPTPPITTAVDTGPLMVPVKGVRPDQLVDSFGDLRESGGAHAHGALDIMAARGSAVLATAPGTIEKIFESDRGGHTVYERSADGRVIFYYAHLDSYAPGLAEGQRVPAGHAIGTVGSTGDASAEGPHLHFEIKRMNPGDRWWQGTAVDPFPLLGGRAR